MNYIKQVNQFYRLLPNNPLSSNAQCLYFYLLNKNNELGWIKEFTIANSIICGFTSLNISAFQRARNSLIQKGYIKYKKGHSNNAGYYTIVEFEQQSEQQNEQHNEQQSDNRVNSTTNTLNKQNKTKQKENNLDAAVDFYNQNINLITPFEYQKLQDYSDIEERLIILAMEKAVTANKRSFNYIDGILKAWKSKGITTLAQARNEEEIFRQGKARNIVNREETEEARRGRLEREAKEMEERLKNDFT